MLNDELLQAFITEFFGYGELSAPVWFIGMEEGGGNSLQEIQERLDAWNRRGRQKVQDLARFHIEFGDDSRFVENAPIQPTWRKIIRAILASTGVEPTDANIRDFQINKLGRKGGNIALLELLPLPKRSRTTFRYNEWSNLRELQAPELYEEVVLPKRIASLKKLITTYQPKAVIFYGKNFRRHFELIAGVTFPGTNYSIVANTNRLYMMLAHPVAFGHMNDVFDAVGAMLLNMRITSRPTDHPHADNNGNRVYLADPNTPSVLAAWKDCDSVATVVPGGKMPKSLNSIAFEEWRDAPDTDDGWNSVMGQLTFDEPPFDVPAGKIPAAGVVIEEADGRIWLVAPSNAFGGYKTTFPKGRIDQCINLQACAIREAFEEAGLQVRITGWLADSDRSRSYTRYYWAVRTGGNPASMGWESQAVHLVPRSALDAYLTHPNDLRLLESIRALEKIEFLVSRHQRKGEVEMHDYFYSVFPGQLKLLSYMTPPERFREMHRLDNTLFFGGADWENVVADLSKIPEEDRSRFIFSLFMIIMTDQALFTYSRNDYDQWQMEINFPKFVWFGYDKHNENPFKLFWAPENIGLVDINNIIGEMPNFVNFLFDESIGLLGEIRVDVTTYFWNIRNDPAYSFNEGDVVPAFKSAFENELNRRFG